MILGSIYSAKSDPKVLKSCAESGENCTFSGIDGTSSSAARRVGDRFCRTSGAWASLVGRVAEAGAPRCDAWTSGVGLRGRQAADVTGGR